MPTEIVGRGLVEILPDFKKFGPQLMADMRIARTQLDGSAAGLRRAAATVAPAMAKIGKGVSLIGVGVAVASVKMAGDFEAETAVLQTAAGETSKNLGIVRQGIMDISKGTGTGLKNLTDGMYTIEKAGFRGAGGLQVLKAAAQGAREENASLADVTNAMTSVMASYHLKTTDSVRVMNALKTSAGEGKITMEEFSGALSTVLPIASANKISFEEVGGAIATLTQHGTSAREATQELAATIRQLAAPNNVAMREMSRFGLSATDVSQNLGKRGLTGTFDLLTGTILKKMGPSGKILMSAFEGTKQSAKNAQIMLGQMPPELQKVAKEYLGGKMSLEDWTLAVKGTAVGQQPMLRNFRTLVDRSKGFSRELKSGGPAAKTYTDALKKMSGGAIGLNTILQLTGESMPGFKERVAKTGESFHNASKDVEGWGVTQNLFNVRLDRFKQTIQVLMIKIGTGLLPVVGSLFSFFSDHQTTLMVVIGLFGSFLGMFAGAYIGMKLYGVYTGIATAATWAFGTANGASRAEILALRIGIIGLAVAEKASAIATGIATAATWAWSAALNSTGIPLIIIGIAALIAAIVWIAVKTTWFQTAWKYTWNAIKVAALFVWRALQPVWKGIVIGFKAIMLAAKAVWTWLKTWWPLVVALITGPIGMAVIIVIRHWDSIYKGLKSAWNAVIGFFARVGGWIIGALGNVGGWLYAKGKAILTGMVRGLVAVATTLSGWFMAHVIKPIINFFAPAVSWLYNKGKDILTGLVRGNLAVAHTLSGWFSSHVIQPVISFFSRAGSWLYNRGRDIITGLVQGNLAVARTLSGWFSSHVIHPVIGFFAKAGTWLYDHGKQVVSGLISGARKQLSTIGSWAKSVYNAVVGAIKHVFGIKSPSTVMAGLGGHMMAGLMRGLLRGSGVLTSTVKRIFSSPLSAAKALISKGVNVTGFLGKNAASLASQLFGTIGGAVGLGKGTPSGAAQSYAASALGRFGWNQGEFGSLKALWNGESGWRWNALNQSSGAYGIPQSLPASKMASAGADWKTNAATQINWGLKYIKDRYGSPNAAYGAWLKRSPHWYDRGGLLPKGLSLAANDTGASENMAVFTDSQWGTLKGLGNGASAGAASAPAVVHLTVHNHGVIGSRHEVENWLVETLDQLRRKNRLPRALGGRA